MSSIGLPLLLVISTLGVELPKEACEKGENLTVTVTGGVDGLVVSPWMRACAEYNLIETNSVRLGSITEPGVCEIQVTNATDKSVKLQSAFVLALPTEDKDLFRLRVEIARELSVPRTRWDLLSSGVRKLRENVGAEDLTKALEEIEWKKYFQDNLSGIVETKVVCTAAIAVPMFGGECAKGIAKQAIKIGVEFTEELSKLMEQKQILDKEEAEAIREVVRSAAGVAMELLSLPANLGALSLKMVDRLGKEVEAHIEHEGLRMTFKFLREGAVRSIGIISIVKK